MSTTQLELQSPQPQHELSSGAPEISINQAAAQRTINQVRANREKGIPSLSISDRGVVTTPGDENRRSVPPQSHSER